MSLRHRWQPRQRHRRLDVYWLGATKILSTLTVADGRQCGTVTHDPWIRKQARVDKGATDSTRVVARRISTRKVLGRSLTGVKGIRKINYNWMRSCAVFIPLPAVSHVVNKAPCTREKPIISQSGGLKGTWVHWKREVETYGGSRQLESRTFNAT